VNRCHACVAAAAYSPARLATRDELDEKGKIMGLLNQWRYALCVLTLLALALAARQTAAQALTCDDPDTRVGSIDRVDYNPTKMRVEVSFNKPIKRQDLAGAPNNTWVLVDITEAATDRPITIIGEPLRGDYKSFDPSSDRDFTTVLLSLNQPLKPGHEYRIFQQHLTFFGCKPKTILEGSFQVKDNTAGGAGASMGTGASAGGEKKPSFFAKSPSDGRDDSNVYLSGEIEGAHKSKTQFTSDVKIDIPLASAGVFDRIGPYFSMKASTAKDADANSLKFGAKLRHSHNISRPSDPTTHQFIGDDRRVLTGLVFDLIPGFESDRRFNNVNTLLDTRLYFIPRVQGGTHHLYFQPFVGYEIGRNIKSPVAAAEGHGLSRPYFGSSLYLRLMPKTFSGASLQVDYVRRFLLRREFGFKEDDSGKPVLLDVGRGPRDYLKAAFSLDFSDFTGLTISYEHGRVPPNFQLVDSKFAFGIVYKFKTNFPAK
jgi:hypothetical protein